uniref:Immunoglobulin domain-containing protein n=1 Tax=Fundulus heteroclitus TaxID=8078 RepID=A0A3Q2P9G6_FUNHE
MTTTHIIGPGLKCNSLEFDLSIFMSKNGPVRQTPAYIQANPGGSATISCSHSIQSYDVILWYKRSEDAQLQLLGHVYLDNKNPEPGVDVEMGGRADKDEICTLTIKPLNVKSSAVYFCAARYHSAAYHCCSVQKPPLICVTAHILLHRS